MESSPHNLLPVPPLLQEIPVSLEPGVDAIREQLPRNLTLWNNPESEIVREKDVYWELLRPVFSQHGYVLWKKRSGIRIFNVPDKYKIVQNGWAYASPVRDIGQWAGGTAALTVFHAFTYLCHAAIDGDGQSVVIRIVKMGDEGQQHLDILRRMCRGPHSLMGANHAIPLLREIQFEDMTFGVFPFVGFPVDDAYEGWAEDSAGNIVDMIIQMLEALSYIHKHRIAHLDAYKENFMVQFHPESLKAGKVAVTRPRVVLIDFESAVQFPADTPISAQVFTGPPRGTWQMYGRKCPPEVYTGQPYDPYKVDVWQLGCSFSNLRTTFLPIDTVLDSLMSPDRLSASAYLDQLRDVVNDIPPKALLIPPVVLNPHACVVTN